MNFGWRIQAAICGGIGGVLAPMLTVAQDLLGDGARVTSLPAWLAGVAIMFGLGAAVAWITGERVLLKALAIGVSLPATVTVLQQNGVIKQQDLARPSNTSSFVFPAIVTSASAAEQRMMVVGEVPFGANDYRVWFFGDNGQLSPTVGTPSDGAAYNVPSSANAVAIEGPLGWSLPAPIPDRGFDLEIEQRSDFSRGFREAFGADSSPYEIQID